MEVLRSYVVRLYREGPAGITGVVESVETGVLRPFRSPEDLWLVLQTPTSQQRPRSTNLLQENEK
jgi:hypothetical protein